MLSLLKEVKTCMTSGHTGSVEQTNWDSVFAGMDGHQPPQYDDWLIKHIDLLETSRHTAIIDLGCGTGCDSLFVTERGYDAIACDWSEEALLHVQRHVPLARTLQVNLLEQLPFADKSAVVIIADLSLHYFSWEATLAIIQELERVLQPEGCLLCRLNSVRDVNFGAGIGEEIEPDYYEHEGRRKRYFNKERLERLFGNWDMHYIEEAVLHRYGKPKFLWELAVRKKAAL
jgi:SAM-dependent methyltransferase